jgi:hypothetical protein
VREQGASAKATESYECEVLRPPFGRNKFSPEAKQHRFDECSALRNGNGAIAISSKFLLNARRFSEIAFPEFCA